MAARSGSRTKKPSRARAKGGGKAGPSARELAGQLEAVRAIGAVLGEAVGLDALFRNLIPKVSQLLRAERSTLFLFDAENDEIWSKAAQGDGLHEIRLKVGAGLAGWVAAHRQPLAVADAYDDARFNPDVDARTGFRTRSVAAAPLIDRHGQLLGVLQVLNHKGGPFSPADLGLLAAIATPTAYAVENARLAERLLSQNQELDAAQKRAERRRQELDLLYELERDTSSMSDLDTLLSSVINRASARLRSEAGSVLLLDKDSGKLYFRAASGPKKDELRHVVISSGEGVVGWVAQHGAPLIVNHAQGDPRHGRQLAEKLDYPARSLAAVPLIWEGKVVGALEVMNPSPRATGAVGYDDEDLKLLTLIAAQVARIVASTLERKAKEDTERLAVIGRMLAGVAHDLRNPMTVISGYAQLMTMAADESERGLRCERILQQIDEMTGMIADLLAFARGDNRLKPVRVSAERLAKELEAHIGLQCTPRGIDLRVTASGDSVSLDLGRVKRIIYNLARNAVDVLGRGDTLEIELRAEAEVLHVRVTDSGPGIPDALRAKLFTPFLTTTKATGSGLGLSIVKRFVEDHRGEIRVDSEPGRGTTFFVRLPSCPTPAPAGVPAREAVS